MYDTIFLTPEHHDRLALLIGSAPKGKVQTKVNEMVDFLITDAGGSWEQRDIMLIPNGTDEESIDQIQAFYGTEKMFYYICTETPVAEWEKTVWVGGNEIPKSIFEPIERHGIKDVQVIYDSCRDFVDFNDEYEN